MVWTDGCLCGGVGGGHRGGEGGRPEEDGCSVGGGAADPSPWTPAPPGPSGEVGTLFRLVSWFVILL